MKKMNESEVRAIVGGANCLFGCGYSTNKTSSLTWHYVKHLLGLI